MSLSTNVLERKDGEYAITLDGRLDTQTTEGCEQDIAESVQKAKVIMFDLENLEYISSMGLRLLLKVQKELKERGAHLFFVKVQPAVEKVFEVAQILPHTDIFDSVESADIFLDAIQRKEQLKDFDVDD